MGKNPFFVLICRGRRRAVPNLDANWLFKATCGLWGHKKLQLVQPLLFFAVWVGIHFWGSVHFLPTMLSRDVWGRRLRAACVASDPPAVVELGLGGGPAGSFCSVRRDTNIMAIFPNNWHTEVSAECQWCHKQKRKLEDITVSGSDVLYMLLLNCFKRQYGMCLCCSRKGFSHCGTWLFTRFIDTRGLIKASGWWMVRFHRYSSDQILQ